MEVEPELSKASGMEVEPELSKASWRISSGVLFKPGKQTNTTYFQSLDCDFYTNWYVCGW